MNRTTIILLLTIMMSIVACTVEPKKINYGEDACHYCSMTIVDRQHAAEIVTKKGKAFKFDATECMIRHIQEIDSSTIALYLTSDYLNPESLIDAKTASYIISEQIPSPMGAFLSATKLKEGAEQLRMDKGGELYNWGELLTNFKK